MPAPIIPWQPSNIPSEIQYELNRRAANRSFAFVPNQTANWDSNTGDWNTYKGPMTSWVRMCSNSAGSKKVNKKRFVLYGGKGFYQTYGFSKPSTTSPSQQIIGYTPGENSAANSGVAHVIDNSLNTPSDGNFPIHVATPEISRINVTIQKELLRRATIEWVCFSWKQLEYMTPYFLVPGITVMVEWGWNHFNPASLVPLYDKSKLKDLWNNAYPLYTENILKSKGNYDVIYGIVSNFNWSIEGNKIICNTEVTSKDRLYAGISKDDSLTITSAGGSKTDPDPIFKTLTAWISDKDIAKNILTIASSDNIHQAIAQISAGHSSNAIWKGIFNPLVDPNNPGVYAMKSPYTRGVFAGRTKDVYPLVGKPDEADFDRYLNGADVSGEFLWINMGLAVEILNYFLARPGGNGKPMFSVDIQNSVIGGHPNLISCNSKVLIPNSKAPKFHYGSPGITAYAAKAGAGTSPYLEQFVNPLSVSSPADDALRKTFQQKQNCYRNDLDMLINFLRYKNVDTKGIVSKYGVDSWSFPSDFNTFDPLPDSLGGLPGNHLVAGTSGLLSNIYIRFDAFKDSITTGLHKENPANTFKEILKDILRLLMESVDGFWDLDIVEVDQNMTITDKKHIGPKQSMPDDPLFVFDYYDANSLIKTLKFHPQLSDAQATRAIYGAASNVDSKYSTSDINDILDYKFKDDVNFDENERKQDDSKSSLGKRPIEEAKLQTWEMAGSVQHINVKGDEALQMSVPVAGGKEVFKLCLPPGNGQRLLRMLLNDKDEKNNPRYCAVQPGIVLELVLLGIGGLRTFQYFMVKNLPEPYSHRNIIFRITDVVQTIESGNWETTIRAQPLPIKAYIKERVRGPNKDGSWPPDDSVTTSSTPKSTSPSNFSIAPPPFT